MEQAAVRAAAGTGLVCKHCLQPVRRESSAGLTGTLVSPAALPALEALTGPGRAVHVDTGQELCADGERVAAPVDQLTAAAS